MWFIPLLSSFKASAGRRRKSSPVRNCRPILEYLEDRRLLSSITGVNPNAGAPGDIVEVFGSFQSGAHVFFHNNVPASFSGSQTSSILTVVVPSMPTGLTDVKVVDPDGTTADLANSFFALAGSSTPAPAPAITGVSPNSGLAAGGTAVTITGTGFQAGSQVFFGTASATVTGTPTATKLTVIAPPLTVGSVVNVKVLNPDGQQAVAANAYTAVATPTAPAPVITDVNPHVGPSGTVIQISGTGFQAGSLVFIGGASAAINGVPTANSISAVVPALTNGPADVKVVNPDGQQVISAGAFVVGTPTGTPPLVSSLSPNFGTAGTVVLVLGGGFQPGAQVFIGGLPATVTNNSPTALTVIAPALSVGPAAVKVVNPDGQQVVVANAFFTVGPAVAPAPVISALTPNTGPLAGGTTVVITGTGFQANSAVFFGSTPATITAGPTATSITVMTPAFAIGGPVDVAVVNPDGQIAVLSSGFTAQTPTGAPPAISSINPTFGPVAGGTTVTISGTGFASDSKVFFGNTQATISGIPTATSITAVTPPFASAGPVSVKVVNSDGQASVLTNGFVAQSIATPAPSITSVSPNFGPTAGGTAVQITGTGFQAGSTVLFGTTPATITGTPTTTTINVVSPALSAGTVDVKVFNPGGQVAVATAAFTAGTAPPVTGAPPVVSGLSQTAATSGTPIQILGTGFQAGSKVFFGSVLAPLSGAPTATILPVLVPSLAAGSLYNVKVVNPDNQSSILPNAFFALPGGPPPSSAPAPVITGISPTTGPTSGGTVVQITGTGFQPASQVLIGGISAAISGTPTATLITVTTPVLPVGPNAVQVVNPDAKQSTVAGGFVAVAPSALPAPTLSSINPTSGPLTGGAIIQVFGTGFQPGAQVFIGGKAAAASGTQTDTTLTVVAPALPVGPASVQVINPDGQQVTLANAYISTPPPGPAIANVTPHFGPAPGTVVQITGAGFQTGTKVFFNNMPATIIGTPTANQLTVSVPAVGTVGPTDIAIINPDGQFAVLHGGFVALAAAPVISSIVPNTGPTTGGTVVTITGSGFQAGSAVFISNIPAVFSATPTATTLSVVTPPLAPGPVEVRVVNPDGQTASVAGGFTAGTTGVPTPGPLITSINPTSGPVTGGTAVTITGTGFQTGSSVSFAGIPATITGTPTATSLTVTVPALPTTGPTDVKVVNPDGKFFVLAGAFTAQPGSVLGPPPVVSAISPKSGAPGTQVQITGSGFVSGTQVSIGGIAAPLSGTPTATTLTVVVPGGLAPNTKYDVKVANPDGQQVIQSQAFTVLPAPPPMVSNVNPSAAAPGTVVQVLGTGFQPGSKVFFGKVQATVSGTPTSTVLNVVVPNLAGGTTVDVTVVNPDGAQSVLPSSFTVLPH